MSTFFCLAKFHKFVTSLIYSFFSRNTPRGDMWDALKEYLEKWYCAVAKWLYFPALLVFKWSTSNDYYSATPADDLMLDENVYKYFLRRNKVSARSRCINDVIS